MQRDVQPELLDELPASDPCAMRSRRDLRRVNSLMGNAASMASCLEECWPGPPPATLVELGAGDGTFLLSVAQRLPARWRNVAVRLIDRQNLLTQSTSDSFTKFGWSVTTIEADVFAWLESSGACDVITANLFLHHFPAESLRRLFELAAGRAGLLVACEPGRTRLSRIGVRLLPLIGCNGVTRHDAVTSVRAGFNGQELSALWPEREHWELRETPAGLGSHIFVAKRI